MAECEAEVAKRVGKPRWTSMTTSIAHHAEERRMAREEIGRSFRKCPGLQMDVRGELFSSVCTRPKGCAL